MARWIARLPAWSRLFLVISLIGALPLVAAACDDDEPASSQTPVPGVDSDKWRIGLVTNVGGTVTDGGFSESAHIGAQRAAETFGLSYAFAQSADEADYKNQLDNHIQAGRTILIAVGFNMQAITLEYAQQYPDVYFIGVDQSYSEEDAPDNLIGLQFADDEAAFMAGALAGLMSESGVVAVIGGMEIPPVVRLANGFKHGAAYVNPAVEVQITYTGDFNAPTLGIQAVDDFVAAGADVIFGAAGPTGYAGIQYAAREKGVWVIGVDQDEWRTNFSEGRQEGSDRILTSAVKRVDNAVYQAIEAIVTGQPTATVMTFDTAACGVGYAPFHETDRQIPAEAKTMLETIWRALAAGTLNTGAGANGAEPPASLAAGELPAVPDGAMQPGDCES